jgi:hypothetical protein
VKRLILLIALLNSGSVYAGIIDDDINLQCGPFFIAVTETLKNNVDNKIREFRNTTINGTNHKAETITYDVERLTEDEPASRLNPNRNGRITDTEIVMYYYSDTLRINRVSGILSVEELKDTGDYGMGYELLTVARYSCTSHTRKALNNAIKEHNKIRKEKKKKRKF